MNEKFYEYPIRLVVSQEISIFASLAFEVWIKHADTFNFALIRRKHVDGRAALESISNKIFNLWFLFIYEMDVNVKTKLKFTKF